VAHSVCPWWLGYFLASPLRRLGQDPRKVLGPHVAPGMTVLDVGCAMGFFTLDAARMVGPSGRVVAVDLQPRMIASLERRAQRAGLADRIETRVCPGNSLGLEDLTGRVDFALAFAMVHEVPDQPRLMAELRSVLRESGRLLVAEPSGHVTEDEFRTSIGLAEQAGFAVLDRPAIRRSRSVVLTAGPAAVRLPAAPREPHA
jgi:ubiquinone/menaquinone biosynthesis C-methylase UbiE